jgi:hypothetical protein
MDLALGASTDKRKAEQLGMSHGTAAHRLKKMTLFDVLRRHGENVCFRCDAEIATVEELSIEHKEAWLDNDPALFWDIENIAFSHAACNRPKVRRIEGPVGMSWCSAHQGFAPVEEFRRGKRWNGLASDCNDCHRADLREYQRTRRAAAGAPSNGT